MVSGHLNYQGKWIALPFPLTQVIRPKLKISCHQFPSNFQYSLPDSMLSHFLRSLLAVKVETIWVAYEWDLNFMGQYHLESVIGQYVFCTLKRHFHFFGAGQGRSWIIGMASNNSVIHVFASTIILPFLCKCQFPFSHIWENEKARLNNVPVDSAVGLQLDISCRPAEATLTGCIFLQLLMETD